MLFSVAPLEVSVEQLDVLRGLTSSNYSCSINNWFGLITSWFKKLIQNILKEIEI